MAASQKVKPAKKKNPKVKTEKSLETGNGKKGKENDEKKKSKKRKKDKKDKKKSKKGPGPALHFTHGNKPQIVDNDLDPHIFSQCKEKLRPVKKMLKHLSENPAAKEIDCLLKIGSRILECLNEHRNDPEVAKEWRNHLWTFVSKFTEYSPKRVYKMYKHAIKNSNGVAPATVNKSSYSRSYQQASHHRHHPPPHNPQLHNRPPKRESDLIMPTTSPPKRPRPDLYPQPGYGPGDGYTKFDRYGHPIRKLPPQHSGHGGHGDGPPRLNPHLQPSPHLMRQYPPAPHGNLPLLPHPPQLHAGGVVPPVPGPSRPNPNWNVSRGFSGHVPAHTNLGNNNANSNNYPNNNNTAGRRNDMSVDCNSFDQRQSIETRVPKSEK